MKTNVYKLTLVKEKAVDYRVRDFKIYNPNSVADFIDIVFDARDLPEEHVWILCCDTKGHIIGTFEVSHGSIDGASADTKDIIKRVLLTGAPAFVIAHNHPSGLPTPSATDDAMTFSLEQACQIMGLRLIDHVIIGDGVNYSYKEEGKIE